MTTYEMGPSTPAYKVITGDLVTVFISSNITSFTSEKRFDKSIAVAELRFAMD